MTKIKMEQSNLTLPDKSSLPIPCKPGEVSDGYHTFDELYDHRCVLFITICTLISGWAYKSRKHHDGSSFDGWFIVGVYLPQLNGSALQITYHLPDKYWDLAKFQEQEFADEWDGHTSNDVLNRLKSYIERLNS